MDPQKLVVFPQIEFHIVSDDGRNKAQKWKEKNHLVNKIANLSEVQLKDGLRILIPYLLQKNFLILFTDNSQTFSMKSCSMNSLK